MLLETQRRNEKRDELQIKIDNEMFIDIGKLKLRLYYKELRDRSLSEFRTKVETNAHTRKYIRPDTCTMLDKTRLRTSSQCQTNIDIHAVRYRSTFSPRRK